MDKLPPDVVAFALENPEAFKALVKALFTEEMAKAIAEENRIAEDEFLHGTPGGEMPVGILDVNEGGG